MKSAQNWFISFYGSPALFALTSEFYVLELTFLIGKQTCQEKHDCNEEF